MHAEKETNKKGFMKWIFAAIVLVIIVFFGFTFKVNEGECAIVSRFGAARAEITQAGMYFKLPWPFEEVKTYDARKQYLDSGYLETLTKDKKNIIMQTYAVWKIEDPLKYYTSVGTSETAKKYLNDLITNVKNGAMGNYELSSIVSLDADNIKTDEIESTMLGEIAAHAKEQYGIKVDEIKIKRLGLPQSNIDSVFQQMQADRKKYVDQLNAEGERDSKMIISDADAKAAEIVASGREEAAKINAETEKTVAKIYADAHTQDPALYTFLQKLVALEAAVDKDTVIITRKDEAPFDALDGID